MPYHSETVEESSASSLCTKRSTRQRRKPTIWTREKIYKLIELYRASDCLWNHYSELYKNKECRAKAIDHICSSLGITKNDYGKKVHNLRNQFNSELKKYERRLKSTGELNTISAKACRWEHFETLMFLRPIIEPRPGYQPQCKKMVNNDEYSYASKGPNVPSQTPTASNAQLEEIIQLELLNTDDISNSSTKEHKNACDSQVTPKSETMPNTSTAPYSYNNHRDCLNPPQTDKRAQMDTSTGPISTGAVRDQWDAFGELIANEFRNLNSSISRKKLKRKIMQIMLEVGEEDDEKYTNDN